MIKNVGTKGRIRIYEWLRDNQAELSSCSAPEAAVRLKADTGIDTGSHSIIRIAREMEIPLFLPRKAVPIGVKLEPKKGSLTIDVLVEIAKELRDINEELGRKSQRAGFLNGVVGRQFQASLDALRPKGI